MEKYNKNSLKNNEIHIVIHVTGMVTSPAWVTNTVTTLSPLKSFGIPELYFRKKSTAFSKSLPPQIVQKPQGLT